MFSISAAQAGTNPTIGLIQQPICRMVITTVTTMILTQGGGAGSIGFRSKHLMIEVGPDLEYTIEIEVQEMSTLANNNKS